MNYILILVNVVIWRKRQEMPGFCCDVDVLSVFTRCEALQMFTAFERNSQDLYFNLFTYI